MRGEILFERLEVLGDALVQGVDVAANAVQALLHLLEALFHLGAHRDAARRRRRACLGAGAGRNPGLRLGGHQDADGLEKRRQPLLRPLRHFIVADADIEVEVRRFVGGYFPFGSVSIVVKHAITLWIPCLTVQPAIRGTSAHEPVYTRDSYTRYCRKSMNQVVSTDPYLRDPAVR